MAWQWMMLGGKGGKTFILSMRRLIVWPMAVSFMALGSLMRAFSQRLHWF
jgi:hypothetical protein